MLARVENICNAPLQEAGQRKRLANQEKARMAGQSEWRGKKKSNGTALQHPLEVGTQNNLPVCPPLELALLASNVSEINLHQQDK